MEYISKVDALKKIAELEQYAINLDSLESKEQEMEKLFLELMNQGLTLEIYSNEQEINYYDDNTIIVSIDLKNKVVWFCYYKFLSKFNSKFNFKYFEIRRFLNGMVEKHLNCIGFKTGTRHGL